MSTISLRIDNLFVNKEKRFVYKAPSIEFVAQKCTRILLANIAQIIGETANQLELGVNMFANDSMIKKNPFKNAILIRLLGTPNMSRCTDEVLIHFMHYLYAMKPLPKKNLLQFLQDLKLWVNTDMKSKIPFKYCLNPNQPDYCIYVYVHFTSTLSVELSFCIARAGLTHELIKLTFTK